MNASLKSPATAVIGCGYWGRNLVRNFAGLGVLAAVCDREDETAGSHAEKYGVDARSFESVLEDDSLEAVAIATPAVTHAGLVDSALSAGKHVFVEKPLALEVRDAERLGMLAREKGRVLMVGHLLQYHSAFLELSKQVDEGRLGSLQYVSSHRLNLGKIRREENILWSFAPHDISMILSLMNGLPEKVTAVSSSFIDSKVADITTSHLEFPGGRSAHIFVSWLHPYKEQKLVVSGDKCMAVFDDTEAWAEKLKLYPHSIQWKHEMPVPTKAMAENVPVTENEPLRAELEHFLDCVTGSIPCRTGPDEAINVLRVLDASERSARENRTVYLNETVN